MAASAATAAEDKPVEALTTENEQAKQIAGDAAAAAGSASKKAGRPPRKLARSPRHRSLTARLPPRWLADAASAMGDLLQINDTLTEMPYRDLDT